MNHHILITDNDLGDSNLERDILERELPGAIVHVRACKTEDEVLTAIRDTEPDGILVQWAPITRAALEAAPHLRAIARFGIGVDMIDLEAAAELGIAVDNVPDYCIEEVASHAIALGLSLWRRLPMLDAELRAGEWNASSSAPLIRRLSESTVALVGLGRIGIRVADAFSALGATVIVNDPVVGDDTYRRVDLSEVAERAHLVSLHAPLLPSTQHIIGPDFLQLCANRPIIVNTSRGGLIDSGALVAALHDGRVGAAGLDVFESEPLAAEDPLRGAPRTILTPHAAWASDAALPELRRRTAMAVARRLTA